MFIQLSTQYSIIYTHIQDKEFIIHKHREFHPHNNKTYITLVFIPSEIT